MSYLELKNLQLNNYKLSFDLLDNTIYGVMGKIEDVKSLLKYLAGINQNNGSCLYQNVEVFDNSEYFKNRLFIDMDNDILKTLTASKIAEFCKSRYNLELDIPLFKKTLNETNARSEVLITKDYKFTKRGVNLANFALAYSLNCKNIISINLTNNLNKNDKIYTIKNLCNKKKYNNMILGFTESDINDYLPYLDKLIILGDFNDVIVIDPKNDTFLYGDDNINIRNRIFLIGSMVIAKCDHTEEELKSRIKIKTKYKMINLNQALKYRYEGTSYEK